MDDATTWVEGYGLALVPYGYLEASYPEGSEFDHCVVLVVGGYQTYDQSHVFRYVEGYAQTPYSCLRWGNVELEVSIQQILVLEEDHRVVAHAKKIEEPVVFVFCP